MKTIILEQVKDNIEILNNIKITDTHDYDISWSKESLLTKYHFVVEFLNKDIDIELDRLKLVVQEAQLELDELIHKYSNII